MRINEPQIGAKADAFCGVEYLEAQTGYSSTTFKAVGLSGRPWGEFQTAIGQASGQASGWQLRTALA